VSVVNALSKLEVWVRATARYNMAFAGGEKVQRL
jgi:DNA gyrase/topoisomerase IV subunit B